MKSYQLTSQSTFEAGDILLHDQQPVTDTLQAALTAVADLAETKAARAVAIYEEAIAAQLLASVRIACDRMAIDAAGGEKGLGANEVAQKRALEARLEENATYCAAREAHLQAQLDRRLTEADAELAAAQYDVLLAALQGGYINLPTPWLVLPGEQRCGRLAQRDDAGSNNER